MRPRIYHVTLNEEERAYLLDFVAQGTAQEYKIMRAQILLEMDESEHGRLRTGKDIAERYLVGEQTVIHVARRYLEGGVEMALSRKKQKNHCRKITDEVEAQMIAIACSPAPEGYARWTLQMIADRLVELKAVDSISATAVGTTLKRRGYSVGAR